MTALAIPFFSHLNLYTQISDNSRKRVLACRNFNFALTPSLDSKRNREVDRWPSMVLSTGQSGVQEWPNPTTVEDMIQQARNALESGLKDGKSRQLFQLLLPIDQRKFNFLDTEPRDYPCGIREEFNACSKVVASILQGSEIAGENTEILSKRIGDVENEMDPISILYPSNKSVAAVVMPISDTLKQIYLMAWDGTSDLIGTTSKQPTYKELEQLVAEARKRIPWKSPPRVLGGSEPAPPPLPKSLSGFLSDEEIDQMDKLSLRRALTALNLPTSGRIEALRERLKEAQKNAPK